jgi:hypothetical protein
LSFQALYLAGGNPRNPFEVEEGGIPLLFRVRCSSSGCALLSVGYSGWGCHDTNLMGEMMGEAKMVTILFNYIHLLVA